MTRPRSSPMAHPSSEDLTRRPRVSADDWRALGELLLVCAGIVFAVLVLGFDGPVHR